MLCVSSEDDCDKCCDKEFAIPVYPLGCRLWLRIATRTTGRRSGDSHLYKLDKQEGKAHAPKEEVLFRL